MHLVETGSERQRRFGRKRGTRSTRQPASRLSSILVQAVAGVFDVELALLRGPTRGRARVALARQVAMYLAHVGCGLSLTETGNLFERDRTTVAYACHIVEARREDPTFDQAIGLLERVITILVWPREAACKAYV
jgi:chromosomal replication initiation ATPase DnaA